MRIEIPNSGIIGADDCAYFEVYSMDIDKQEKVIELNDKHGFVIGLIHYNNLDEVEIDHYNAKGELNQKTTMVIKNGKLVI